MPGPAATHGLKPYKGATLSYEAEDRALFFGRGLDAEQLLAQVLASPVTLLHAASAAGKSSLLSTRLIPDLEARGWHAVRVLPREDDPRASTRRAVLETLFPPPEFEVRAIRRAARPPLAGVREDVSIGDLLKRFAALEKKEPLAASHLLGPYDTERFRTHSGLQGFKSSAPLLSRLLRSSYHLERYAGHWAVLGHGAPVQFGVDRIMASTPVRQLQAALRHEAVLEAYRSNLAEAAAGDCDLSAFFQNLSRMWRERHPSGHNPGIVLIFDQFEEMFTRFVDPRPGEDMEGRMGTLDVRRRFFRELEALYHVATAGEAGEEEDTREGQDAAEGETTGEREDAGEQEDAGEEGNAGKRAEAQRLPLRFVFSMRNEYVALLDELPRMNLALEPYHLRMLGDAQARAAIVQPAKRFGYAYTDDPESDDCVAVIISALHNEEGRVEPAHIQLVCDRLWRTYRADPAAEPLDVIDAGTVGGREGILTILRQSLAEFLGRLSPEKKIASLDILDSLLTVAHTRNVVDERQLLEARFRNPTLRAECLRELVNAKLLRRERRLGRFFVEITHEFLVKPILQALAQPQSARLRDAFRTLARFDGVDFRKPDSPLLRTDELVALDEQAGNIKWEPWTTELMLRSAVREYPNPELVRRWAERYQKSKPLPGPGEFDRVLKGINRRRNVLSADQLRAVAAFRGDLAEQVGPDEAALVLRSLILKAEPEQLPEITFWTGRVKELWNATR